MNKYLKKIIILMIVICLVVFLKSSFKIIINYFFVNNYPDKLNALPLQLNTFVNISEPYIVHYNYGNYYYQKKMYDEAYFEYEKALNYHIPDKNVCQVKYNASLSLVNLASNSLDSEKKELLVKADNYLKECIDMKIKVNDDYLLPKILFVFIITFSITLLILTIVGKKNGKLIPALNREYIKKLELLMNDVKEEEIDNREAYKKMSLIIREFIAKTTKINVLNLTKDEINKLNIHDLSSLMDEYYKNEFARTSKGDILDSLNKTMEVIRTWNWK